MQHFAAFLVGILVIFGEVVVVIVVALKDWAHFNILCKALLLLLERLAAKLIVMVEYLHFSTMIVSLWFDDWRTFHEGRCAWLISYSRD